MTLDEFYDALSKAGRTWRLEGGRIRSEQGECPICAVAIVAGHTGFGALNAAYAGDCLRLSESYRVITAADWNEQYAPRSAQIRRKLLDVCKLPS